MGYTRFELEEMALDARKQMGASSVDDPIDPLKIQIEDVHVITFEQVENLDQKTFNHLKNHGNKDWSAMSIPLDSKFEKWVIIRNHLHEIERQRVSLLEEYWHIMLGHQLTRIVKVAGAHGRTFEAEEEEEAFFLATATLLPREAILKFISDKNRNLEKFANKYGVSKELVEYRIKRLGQWYNYKPKKISVL